jgi:hypothetical protein
MLRYISETLGHYTVGKKPLQELYVLYILLQYFVLFHGSVCSFEKDDFY